MECASVKPLLRTPGIVKWRLFGLSVRRASGVVGRILGGWRSKIVVCHFVCQRGRVVGGLGQIAIGWQNQSPEEVFDKTDQMIAMLLRKIIANEPVLKAGTLIR